MSSLGNDLRRTVSDVLKDVYSTVVILQSEQSTYDPATMENWVTRSNYRLHCAEEHFDSRFMVATPNVQEGDSFITFAAADLPIEPATGMNLFTEGDLEKKYGEVKNVETFRLQGVPIAYRLHVRGIS